MFGLVVIAIAALAVAAIEDIRCRTIPDTAALLLAASGIAACLLAGGFLTGLLIAIALFVCGAALFALRVMGGGDVKLIAAMGFWLTPATLAPFVLIMAMSGGLLALGVVVSVTLNVRGPAVVVPTVPYGVAIAVSGLFILLGTH